MNLSSTAQAMLLLTSYFTKANNEKVKPLNNGEWGRFAFWLKEKSITPADLLVSNPKSLLADWHDSPVNIERIVQLLKRNYNLAFTMEKWQRVGIWVVTRSDRDEYPNRLKQKLEKNAPPVLFGCGNRTLLNKGDLAVVGSRKASESDLSYARQVGAKAASEGFIIVSGGAIGVDEEAMLGAIREGGSVIGVMADNLLKAALSAKWRESLTGDNVVLVSPFYPESSFSVGNAMGRNKYIYCLSTSSLVVHSGKKGGTISGAEENLRKKWVPLWVKPTNDEDAGNAGLVDQGGDWCKENIENLKISTRIGDIDTEIVVRPVPTIDKFYQLFINEIRKLAANPITPGELQKKTCLHLSQLNEWLKRAIEDGVVKKLSHPIRYQVLEIGKTDGIKEFLRRMFSWVSAKVKPLMRLISRRLN